MRWNLRVGVEGKPVDTGTVRSREPGRFALSAKARADAAHLLASPVPKGDALLHGGRHGTGELWCVLHQGIIACRHRRVATRFEVPQRAELADDSMADRLDYRGDVGIAGRLALEKARLAALVGAIQIDALEEDAMEMEIEIDGTAET